MIVDVGLHFVIGLAGAGCGVCARMLCRHRMGRIATVTGLLAAEAYLSVLLIG